MLAVDQCIYYVYFPFAGKLLTSLYCFFQIQQQHQHTHIIIIIALQPCFFWQRHGYDS